VLPSAYHYAIHNVKRNLDDAVCDRFASSLLSSNSSRDFWSEVKRIRSNKCPISSIVDDHSSVDGIANFLLTNMQTCTLAHLMIQTK